MRFEESLSIAAAELWLPPRREIVAEAVKDGRAESERAAASGYLELRVGEEPPPMAAVRAGAAALDRAGVDPDRVGMFTHAWTYYQGQDYWEPVHYIASGLKLRSALLTGVSLGCNGGFAALEAVATRIMCDPAVSTAVVTTAERFCPPAFNRWRSNLDVFYGDSATALVVDRENGPYQLISSATVTAPELEIMYRGSAEWGTAPFQIEPVVDIRTRLKEYLAAGHGPEFGRIQAEAITRTVTSALEQAGLAPDDPRLRMVAPPRFGAELIEHGYTTVLARITKAAVINMGRRTGHLGAGDMSANLADIDEAGLLGSGEYALMLSATAGFSWSCLVLRAR